MGPAPYQLRRGTTLLGAVAHLAPAKATGWLEGALQPAPAWSAVAPLFEAEAAALQHVDRWPDDWQDAWDAAHASGVSIVDATGVAHAVSAHVEGLTLRVQPR